MREISAKPSITALFLLALGLFTITLEFTEARASDAPKWQVCILSEGGDGAYEPTAFEKALPSARFTFTNISTNNLQEMCKTPIKCDVTIISGHYTGFQYENMFNTSDLMKHSCHQDCDHILAPLEVYSFACNTTATKERDFRTDDMYRNALMEHNLPGFLVDLIVQMRYGLIDPSNRDQLSWAFRGAEHFYGFNSTAPTQSQLESTHDLERYLKDMDYDAWLTQVKKRRDAKEEAENNPHLERDFSEFSIEDVRPTTNFKHYAPVGNTFCALTNESSTLTEKIKVAQSVIQKGETLKYFSYLFDFIYSLDPDLNPLQQLLGNFKSTDIQTDDEIRNFFRENAPEVQKKLERATDPKIKNRIAASPILAEIYYMAERFQVLSTELKDHFKSGLIYSIRRHAKTQQADEICAPSNSENKNMVQMQLALQSEWTVEDFEPIFSDQDANELAIVTCLGPFKNAQIYDDLRHKKASGFFHEVRTQAEVDRILKQKP